MIYFYLAIAIVAEVIGTILLPITNNFTRPAPALTVAICYGIAFFMLSMIVKTIPVAIVYAVWSGAGICLVTLAGAVWLKQPLDSAAVIGIVLIVAGVTIINLYSKIVIH